MVVDSTQRERYKRLTAPTPKKSIDDLSRETPTRNHNPAGKNSNTRHTTPRRSTAHPIVPEEEECWPISILIEKYPDLRYERWLPSRLRSAKQSSDIIFDDRLLRGPKGRPLCLWCGEETPTNRALFCATPSGRPYTEALFGEGCEHEHRMRRDGRYVRKQLFLRDEGICIQCGTDTYELYLQATECSTLRERVQFFKDLSTQAPEWLKKARMPLSKMEHSFTQGMFWEAAHVVDVKHGGGLCGLDGLQTLCVPCHSIEYTRNYLEDVSNLSLCDTPATARRATPSRFSSSKQQEKTVVRTDSRSKYFGSSSSNYILSPPAGSSSSTKIQRSQAHRNLFSTPTQAKSTKIILELSPLSSGSSSLSLPSPTSDRIFKSFLSNPPPIPEETPTKPRYQQRSLRPVIPTPLADLTRSSYRSKTESIGKIASKIIPANILSSSEEEEDEDNESVSNSGETRFITEIPVAPPKTPLARRNESQINSQKSKPLKLLSETFKPSIKPASVSTLSKTANQTRQRSRSQLSSQSLDVDALENTTAARGIRTSEESTTSRSKGTAITPRRALDKKTIAKICASI